MSKDFFYPQEGSLYRGPSGQIVRIRTNVNFMPTGELITVYQPRAGGMEWAMRTREFGNLFRYIPNWIDYADDEEIPV